MENFVSAPRPAHSVVTNRTGLHFVEGKAATQRPAILPLCQALKCIVDNA